MVRLAEFPEHRREALLWLHALELDYDGVDDLVAAAEHEPCRWRYYAPEMATLAAVLGDDELYHLVSGEMVLCADVDYRRRRHQLPAGHPHENRYIGGNIAARQGFWVVQLTAATMPIHLVPPIQRCPTFPARRLWPAHHNPATPLGRQHAQLAAALGAQCHGCRGVPAAIIDHDHFTGLVRGLLCRNCNARIDECLHLSGCPWANYLNNPPAAALRLRYCQWGRRQGALSVGQRLRTDALGFNPLA